MASSNPSKFRVAIVGAGLGGLLLALSMQKESPDLDVDIYESATELTEIGAGIGMWPRILEVFRYLDLEDDLVKITGIGDGSARPVHFCKADEAEMFQFHQLPASIHTAHRSDVQKLLAKHLRAVDKIHFSKRLASYTEPSGEQGEISLNFKDGSTATCDVLIGCDGIRSAVRRTMFTDMAKEADARGDGEEASRLRTMIDPVWTGWVAYRCLVPTSKLEKTAFKDAHTSRIMIGKNRHIVHYPVSRGEMVNVVAFVYNPEGKGTQYPGAWVRTATAEEVASQFTGWEAGLVDLLKAMEGNSAWAINAVPVLPTTTRGRVVLLGDAAHAMSPHQGSGAGQAIEDGFILATIFGHPSVTLNNLPEALKVYDTIRRPFSQDVQRRSELTGYAYELNSVGWEKVTEAQSAAGQYPQELLSKIGDELAALMSWVMESSIMGDKERAAEMLQSLS